LLTETSIPTHGDTISGSCSIIIGIHTLCTPTVEPPNLKSPPSSIPCPLGLSLWEPFNRTEHSVSLAMDDVDFMRQDVRFTATLPPLTFIHPPGVLLKYFLHGDHSDKSMLAGAAVVSSDGLCHLLTWAQTRICSSTCLALNSITKTIHASVAFRHSNLRAVLASLTTSPTVYHNQQTNSAWMLPFLLVPRHGSSKFTPISHLSEIGTVKFPLRINSQRQLRLSRPSSTVL
jgi:hypothetical protein